MCMLMTTLFSFRKHKALLSISPAAALGFPCQSPAAMQGAGRRSAGSADASLGTGADS